MNKKHFYITCALSLVIAMPAIAQVTESGGMAEIIVTARRTEERLQDVPISISVFNQEQITARNITTASDLATYIPSLSTNSEFGADNSSFSIRGFTQDVRTTPSVAVYFADAVEPRGGGAGTTAGDGAGAGAFFDLEDVQVLKGPQGTLFGRNTTGGAVLLVPKKPTSDMEGYVEGSYGDYDMKRFQGVINAPLSDKIRVRLGIDTETRDGYVKNTSGVGPTNFDNIDYTAARGSLVVDLTENLENYTIGSFSHSINTGPLPHVFACNAQNRNAAYTCAQFATYGGQGFYTGQNDRANPESLNDQWQIINTTTWNADADFSIKNIFNYGQIKNVLVSSLFGTYWTLPASVPGFGGMIIPSAGSSPPPGDTTNHQSTFTEELRFQGRAFDGRLNWQAGGYLERSSPIGQNGSLTAGSLFCTSVVNFQCTDELGILSGRPGTGGSVGLALGGASYRDYGIYGQATYNLTDRIKATAGIRFSSDESSGTIERISYTFPTPNVPVAKCVDFSASLTNNCFQTFHTTTSAPTGLVDLEYNPQQDLMLYAKYSRGYRQGAVSPFSADGYETYGPEHIDAYEVGEKTTLRGRIPATIDAAAFYNKLEGQQLLVSFLGPAGIAPGTSTRNAGISHIWGTEIDVTIAPVKQVTLSADYAYLNTKLVSLLPITLNPASPYTSVVYPTQPGLPLPLTPKNKASVTGTYILPLPEQLGQASVGLTFVYNDKELTSASSPLGHTPAYDLLNLNINWNSIAGKPVDAAFFVTNLTDKHYVTYVPGFYNALGYESENQGAPRMFGLRLRVHFGK